MGVKMKLDRSCTEAFAFDLWKTLKVPGNNKLVRTLGTLELSLWAPILILTRAQS